MDPLMAAVRPTPRDLDLRVPPWWAAWAEPWRGDGVSDAFRTVLTASGRVSRSASRRCARRHPLVLRGGVAQAAEDGSVVARRGDQQPGRPVRRLHRDAAGGLPRPRAATAPSGRAAAASRVVLGGDHLGPNPWRDRAPRRRWRTPTTSSRAYVEAGFTEDPPRLQHGLRGDPMPLDRRDRRRARGPAGAGRRGRGRRAGRRQRPASTSSAPRCPVPGGAHEAIDDLTADARPRRPGRRWQRHREAFAAAGVDEAWERVVALVVQPGVEFDALQVVDYDRERTHASCSRCLDDEPRSRVRGPLHRLPDRRALTAAGGGPLGGAQGRPGPDVRAARGAVRAWPRSRTSWSRRPSARAWSRSSSRSCWTSRAGGRATTRATSDEQCARPRATATATGCATTGRTRRSSRRSERLLRQPAEQNGSRCRC